MITLDGIMQAPGGPDEDASSGFAYGGWTAPYTDEHTGKMLQQDFEHPADLLLGRKTYDIFSAYWPHQTGFIAEAFNSATKYLASTTPLQSSWEKTVVFKDHAADQIKRLKQSEGRELQVWGSGNLIQTLLENDLVDELRLRIFPLTLGTGKRLFAGGTVPAAFTLQGCSHSPSGVLLAEFKRGGEVKTGSL